MESGFNADAFLDQDITGASETSYVACPEGEYQAMIKEVAGRQNNKDGKISHVLDVTFLIMDENVQTQLGMDEVTCRMGLFLDIKDGMLEFGTNKNVKLGKLREAAGQNDPNSPWRFRMLEGAGPFMVKVEHQPNPRDPENPYANVTQVASMS